MQGRLDWTLLKMYNQHGGVCLSSDVLSFIGEQAWRDIYDHMDTPLIKDPTCYNAVEMPDGAASIFNASSNKYARISKQLSHAFSEKALEQALAVNGYVDLLFGKLRDAASTRDPVLFLKKLPSATNISESPFHANQRLSTNQYGSS